MSPREIAVFAPLVLLTLWIGMYPSSFSGFWDATVECDGRASTRRHCTAVSDRSSPG